MMSEQRLADGARLLLRRAQGTRRQWFVTLLLCAAIQVTSPVRAYAWFGWLDHLSGPGPFQGDLFEFRVACFGDESEARKLSLRLRAAKQFATRLTTSDSADNAEALRASQDLLSELKHALVAFPVFSRTSDVQHVTDLEAAIKRLAMALRPENTRLLSEDVIDRLNGALNNVEEVVQTADLATTSLGSTGVLWSLCSNEKTRRMSLDIGANFWRTKQTSLEFAGDKEIRFVTVMPSISWRLFSNPRFDVLDVSVGGGVYWFSSEGFETFSGIVLQPFLLDIHAPTRWTTYKLTDGKWYVRILKGAALASAVVNVRYGFMTFPSGFEADAFGGRSARRIPAELNQTRSYFFNVKPLALRTRATGS